MITKEELDALAAKYETKDFIKDDPIQFLHRFNDKGKEDAELAGFIASLFAYGNRKMFISKLNDLFARADNDIANYVKNGDFANLKGMEYRFANLVMHLSLKIFCRQLLTIFILMLRKLLSTAFII